MVTLALFAMCGLIGLAVDLGWSFFVEKSAQAAADTAALAAVKAVLEAPDKTCTGGLVTCAATPTACPTPGGNLDVACQYAAQNGFSNSNPRQNVLVQASDALTPPTVQGCTPVVNQAPTAPCVDVVYWVTVRVNQSIPQLWSAIFGKTQGLVSARATAAIAKAEAPASLILLNRQNEAWPLGATGTNLDLGGSGVVRVPGGISLASNGWEAGVISGSGNVISPFTYIRPPAGGSDTCAPAGQICVSGSGTWTAPPTNKPDGDLYYDPFRDLGQPPLNLSSLNLPTIPVRETNGGRAYISASNVPACSSGVCPPGIYFAVDNSTGTTATGTQLEISSDIGFGNSSFGTYVMFGGLNIGQATVNFGPGKYVLAGVNDPRNYLLDNDNKAQLLGGTSYGADAGRIFILTAYTPEGTHQTYYNQLAPAVQAIDGDGFTRAWTQLQYSNSAIKAGNNASSLVRLYGLDPRSTAVQNAGLKDFAPVVIWQDQQNSYVQYDETGNIVWGLDNCASSISLDDPCRGIQDSTTTPQLEIWATPNTQYGGVIYQPRGAWSVLQGSGRYSGALQIVSGAMKIQGTPDLTLTSPSVPITTYVAALIE